MNSKRNRRRLLSKKCSLELARVVLPELREESLAEARFRKFLEKEGLSDHELLRSQDVGDEVAERRRRLFGLVTGGIAAAMVFLSLHLIFGGAGQKSELSASTDVEKCVVKEASVPAGTHTTPCACQVPLP